jgi:predicted enzyme related to lactoylglutathione lyase
MSEPAFNTVAWFEVATDDPDGAQRFYGELFGWSFTTDTAAAAAGNDYRLALYPGAEAPSGGVFNTRGEFPDHACFSVAVRDVSAACEQVERLGGKVVHKMLGDPNTPDFAYVQDTSGNMFEVFTPSPAPSA